MPQPIVRYEVVPVTDLAAIFRQLGMMWVWPNVWQAAFREEEVSEVGDYMNCEIGRGSILVKRSILRFSQGLLQLLPAPCLPLEAWLRQSFSVRSE